MLMQESENYDDIEYVFTYSNAEKERLREAGYTASEIEEMEEENPELAEEDDDYGDCGKETEGQYVAEVSYIGGANQHDAEIQQNSKMRMTAVKIRKTCRNSNQKLMRMTKISK